MGLSAVLDVATLRASRRIVRPEGVRADAGRFVDIDIAAAAQLIEAIVLFDRVLVPDIGHREGVEGMDGWTGLMTAVASGSVRWSRPSRRRGAISTGRIASV